MLRLQVDAPFHGILEFLLGLQEDVDGLGVAQAHEIDLRDGLQPLDEPLVEHVVEELEVVHVVVQRVLHEVLDEILGEVHVVLDIVEGHLRLNHPEFGQVARGVAILGSERGTEGVDIAEGHGAQLALQLSGNRQVGVLAEEILLEIDLSVLGARDVVQVEGGDVEHLAGTFRVGSGD